MFRCQRAALLLVTFATLSLFSGCARAPDPWESLDSEGKKRIVVTVAPLESFVRAVGGDKVAVHSLCTTTGPHHYQADTRDARFVSHADLFFAVGLTLDDSFAEPIVHSIRRKDLRFVQLGEKFPESELLEMKHDCCKHAKPGHEHHHHDKWDPHLWLGIAEAERMVGMIRDELSTLDPENASTYEKNAQEFVVELKKVHAEGKATLANCEIRRIVSFHEALSYFARSFDLEIADVIEQGPGDEPTQGHRNDLIKLCSDRKKPIGAITVEPQYPASSSASVIRDELKRQKIILPLVVIDPMETADPKELAQEGGQWYIKRMRQNVQSLREALPQRKKTP